MLSKSFLKKTRELIQTKIKEKSLTYVLLRGIKKLINFEILIIYPIVFILCVVIRLIKPLFFIRFGSLNAEKIGPFATRTELIICEKENGMHPKKSFDVYHSGPTAFVCNLQLLKMWKRLLYVTSGSRYFWKIMSMFSFGKNHIIKNSLKSRDHFGLIDKSPTHLTFTKEENLEAKKDLLKMGIGDKDKYVLLLNRGEKYLKEVLPHMDLSHNSFRNCNINDFLPAAEMIASKGNIVIRVGHLVSDFLKTKNKKIIEYDQKGFRTELLDIYLSANCRYILNSDSGYADIAEHNFRKPMVNVNFTQLEYIHSWSSKALFTFRKYWLKYEKRFMSIKEIIQSGAGRFNKTKDYEKLSIEIVSNTPREIKDAVDEMEKRLDGTWKDSESDLDLQKRFWHHFKLSDLHGIIRAKISTKFLRENHSLL